MNERKIAEGFNEALNQGYGLVIELIARYQGDAGKALCTLLAATTEFHMCSPPELREMIEKMVRMMLQTMVRARPTPVPPPEFLT